MQIIDLFEAEATLPKIEIKPITKDMRFIYFDGAKVGSLHLGWQSEFQGFNTWRKVRQWTGEFVFLGQTHHVSGAKISEMLANITRRVRGALIRQRDAG